MSRPRLLATVIGLLAAAAGVGVGVGALLHPGDSVTSGLITAREITSADRPIPLSENEVLALLGSPPDFGPMTDPVRRASCLSGLGYPSSTPVLGARTVRMNGRDAVVLVLAGEDPASLVALAVPPDCTVLDTGLLADTTVRRR